jgi:hypothetical protein
MNLREFTAGTQAMVDGVRQHLFGVARLAETLHRPKHHGHTAMFLIIIGQLDSPAARINPLLKPERHRSRSANPLILPGLA